MKRYIKKYIKFKESISGTLTNVNGPGMPRQELRNTLSQDDTNIVFDEITNKFYSEDEYFELYKEYIANGGSPLEGGLNKENLEKVLNI
jgi:hypothetical protein